MKAYRAANKERRAAYEREYRRKRKEVYLATRRAWNEKNKERNRARQFDWYCQNRSEVNARKAAYRRQRYAKDPMYRIRCQLRNVASRLKRVGWEKDRNSLTLFGCTFAELHAHLEAQFKPGMAWENYGYRGWHIDHIRPLSSFDVSRPEEVAAACHYTNLQPLWWFENLRKGNRAA